MENGNGKTVMYTHYWFVVNSVSSVHNLYIVAIVIHILCIPVVYLSE